MRAQQIPSPVCGLPSDVVYVMFMNDFKICIQANTSVSINNLSFYALFKELSKEHPKDIKNSLLYLSLKFFVLSFTF